MVDYVISSDRTELLVPNPKVSIIVPVYNGANYMREAIDSALAQTWANTEVIVVNDGSTDDGETDRIARSYGDRIRYISKSNGGVASALNAGIKAMTGEIFCWLSHDDLHAPAKTEEQVAYWIALGCPRDIVLYSDYSLIDASGALITEVAMNHEMVEEKPLYSILRGAVHGCSIFVPRVLFEKAGLFDVSLPTTQDYDLWFRMMKYARFMHMKRTLIKSRWHDEQGSKKIDHVVEANALWSGFLEKVPPEEQQRLEGSVYRFQKEMEAFLRQNGILSAADQAAKLAEAAIEQTLVSVVIPVHNRPEQALSAINSALAQSHAEIEVIVVNDGSTSDIGMLERSIGDHPRIRYFRQENKGAAAARNFGWSQANGEYVAFLDSDDLFLPEKIAVQVRLMAREQSYFSHMSYWLHLPGTKQLEMRNTGRFGGAQAFPEMIASCPIATPTVMVRRDLVENGFKFPEGIHFGEDAILWIRLASQYGVQGIDRALTLVRAGASSAAYDPVKQLVGLENIISAIESDAYLSQFNHEIARLKNDAIRHRKAGLDMDPAEL